MAEINTELSKKDVVQPTNPTVTTNKEYEVWRAGIITISRANDVIKSASERPEPRKLWDEFWYEGELGCLFSDSNTGKSILAVQIGEYIARQGNIVIYFDFELSDKQFQLRYSDEANNLYQFSPNFLRAEISPDQLSDEAAKHQRSFEEMIKDSIEETIKVTNAKILIIDNLTYMCINNEKGSDAGTLMVMLKNMKQKYGLSMLVLAHTPKRLLWNPLTQNDLAGSKRQMNFFDSAFAIGKSSKDPGLRYLKQIKFRNGEFKYDENNVVVFEIEKKDAFTQFVRKEYSTEQEHLKQKTDEDRAFIESEVKRLINQGWTYRPIADKLGISKSSVGIIANRCDKK